MSKDAPNIILINCDDLGYGDLGCYGSQVNSTPHLDRMASEGVRFTDFYMAAPICTPSRGAMMTGCYPRRIGFGSFDNDAGVLFPGMATGLNPSETTIAKVLKQRGYATRIVGKWHCGDQREFLPTRHGFDGYFGLPYSNDMSRQAGMSPYPPLPLMLDEEVIQQQPDQAALTERYVDDCVRFMRANRDRPFFLYFAHMYVHLPIYAPQRFLDQSRNGAYGAAVAAVDWSVGVIMAELKKLGLDNNTLVVFTSDNGARGDHGGSNAPLRGGKQSTWEGGLRVPCIMRWPGMIKPGQVSSEVVTAMDFLPTFARVSDAPLPGNRIDGKDILDVARGEAPSPHKAFYYYRMNDLDAVRAGRWKLHVSKWGQEMLELYDLVEDIGETRNLAAEQPNVVAELQELLEEAREDLGDALTGRPGANCRPVGRVENPVPLTVYEEDYPYFAAEYDLPDRG